MGINEFVRKVCSAMEKKLGPGYRIEVKEIRKNNGVLLHGLLIMSDGQNIAPTIYLDSFWEAYEGGTSFAAVVGKLLAIYREDAPKEPVDLEFFRSYEAVKDRICYRLVGRKGNEALLEDVPHIEFLDMAVCFYYAYCSQTLGEGIISVHNTHMKMWDAGTADLFRLAWDNTPMLFPWECSTMDEILDGKKGGASSVSDAAAGVASMKVLSNARRLHGAVCILYPQVLEKIAAAAGRSLYIIPSSIHEVILLEDRGKNTGDALRRMIAEVNRTQVPPEEVLSDNLYYYDLDEKKIKIFLN